MEKKMIITIAIIAVIIVAVGGIAYSLMQNQHKPKDIRTVDDLEGAWIGVQLGTTGDYLVTDDYEATGKATIQRFDTYPQAVMALKDGKIDAIVMDKLPGEIYVSQNEGIKILTDQFADPESYAFALNKSKTTLRDEFNTALATIKANGTIDEIVAYWAVHANGEADPYITSTGTGATIKVATSPDFPPYDTMYGNVFTGIDMDIIRAICNELGYQVQFDSYNFNGVLAAVETGTADVAASGITYTEARAEKMLFTDEYTTSVQVVVVRVVPE